MLPGPCNAVSATSYNYGPLADTYTNKSDGVISTFDTGQAKVLLNTTANSALRVVSGKLTNIETGAIAAAGYQYANLGQNVTRIGGSFILSQVSGSPTLNGAAVFLVMNNFMPTTTSLTTACHFVISKTGWLLQYVISGVFTTYASGSLSLAYETPYTAQALLDSVSGKATLFLPDGTTQVVSNAVLTSGPGPGQYACFEVFASNASSDDKAKFINVFAS